MVPTNGGYAGLSWLKFDDQEYGDVEVPGPNGPERLRIRSLTAQEREQLRHTGNYSSPLIALLGCIDADGKRLFSEEHLEALEQKNGETIDAIASAVMKLSAIDQKGAEELGKVSGETESGASSSDSP